MIISLNISFSRAASPPAEAGVGPLYLPEWFSDRPLSPDIY